MIRKSKKSLNGRPSKADEIDKLVRELIPEPDRWLDTENYQLGGKKPKDIVGTPQELVLLDLLHAIDQGMFS